MNILKVCSEVKIKCNVFPFESISYSKETHFVVDGHLTPYGNSLLGNSLVNIF